MSNKRARIALGQTSTKLSLGLKPLSAKAGGIESIKAKVTVENGGFAIPNASVTLKLEGNATFSDNSASEIEATTGADGRVEKLFTDLVPEENYITAFVTSDKGAFAEALYKFTGKVLSFGKPLVDDSNGFADGISLMHVRVQLLEDGKDPVPNEHVRFIMIDGSATFPGNQREYVSQTGPDGFAEASFVDTVEEMGMISIRLEESVTPVRTTAQFTSRPIPKIVLNVDPNSAPADGKTAVVATATVSSIDGKTLLADVDVTFTYPEGLTPASPQTVKTGSDGTAKLSITSKKMGEGEITAVIAANDKYKASANYSFGNAWAGIVGFSMVFDGASGVAGASIFRNGLHQGKLSVQFTLKDGQDQILTNDNSPTIDAIINATKLLDYNEPSHLLGADPLKGMSWSLISNEFVKHLTTHTFEGQTFDSDSINRISDGIAYFTYYVVAEQSVAISSINLGAAITLPDGSIIYNAIDGTFKASTAPLYLLNNERYRYKAQNLDLKGDRQAHEGESDAVPKNQKGGGEDPGNYWRRWDYRVGLNAATEGQGYSPYVYRCCLARTESLPSGYAYSEYAGMAYASKIFLWPMNLYDSSRVRIPESDKRSFTLTASGQPDKQVTFGEGEQDVWLTYYMSFGDINVRTGAGFKKPIPLKIYDQYGNSGDIHLDPYVVTDAYDVGYLDALPFAKDGFDAVDLPFNAGSTGTVSFQTALESGMAALGLDTHDKLVELFGSPPLSLLQKEISWTLAVSPASGSSFADSRTYQLAYQQTRVRAGKSESPDGPYVASSSGEGVSWNMYPLWNQGGVMLARADDTAGRFLFYKYVKYGLTDGEEYATISLYTAGYQDSGAYQWKVTQ